MSEDGNQDEPNDYDGPSVIDFHFDPPLPLVTEVHVLDIDNEGNAGFVTAYDADGLEIQSQPLLPLGSNSFQVVPIGAFNVSRLEISVGASAGVSGIVFCTQCGANFEGDFRTISASPAGLKKLF